MNLHSASEAGNEGAVKTLLRSGEDVNALDNFGRTPLSWAAENGYTAVVKLLLEKDGVDPDTKDNSGQTPLSRAAKNGHTVVVKLLLEKDGIDPNTKDNGGQTPLCLAAAIGREAVVKLLLEKDGVDPDTKDNDGRTPLSWAVAYRYTATAVVKLLLEKDGIDPDTKDNDGRTPLYWAVKEGHGAVVKLLLEKDGIDPDTKDNDGRTLLWLAAANRRQAVIRLLANDGANRNSENYPGRTPLSWAAENGHTVVVNLLLKDNIDPNSKDNDGRTPLSRAAENRHEAVVRLLAPGDKVTLHILVQEGKHTPVKLLLNAKYDVNVRDALGRTPLHIAVSFGYLDIARELISSRANINSEDTDGMTPLRLALQRKDQDLIQLLLNHSVSIKGIMADEWLDAYEKKASNITVELSEVPGREKCVRFLEGIPDKMSAEPGTVKHLFLFADYSAWLRCLISNPRDAVQSDRSQIFHQEQIHSACVSVSVAGCYPAGQDPGNEKCFDISDWGECGIAWTMSPPTKPKDGLCWKSIDHFSMLPYGWIPDNGADFFTQFILNLKGRWLGLCSLAEEHLSRRRLDQLREKGDSPELIHYLAEDAQEWAKLRSILRGQVRTARNLPWNIVVATMKTRV